MAWKLVNPNITNDPSYLDPRLSDDESKISSNTTSLADIAYDVKNYGAKANGTDDTSAFISAINDAIAHGSRIIYVPSGKYSINLQLTQNNIKIYGSGTVEDSESGGGTILTPFDVTKPCVQIGNGISSVQNITLQDISVHGTGASATQSDGLYILGAYYLTFKNIKVYNFGRDNIVIDSIAANNIYSYYIHFVRVISTYAGAACINNKLSWGGIFFDHLNAIPRTTSGAYALKLNNDIQLSNSYIDYSDGHCIFAIGTPTAFCNNVIFDSTSNSGVYLISDQQSSTEYSCLVGSYFNDGASIQYADKTVAFNNNILAGYPFLKLPIMRGKTTFVAKLGDTVTGDIYFDGISALTMDSPGKFVANGQDDYNTFSVFNTVNGRRSGIRLYANNNSGVGHYGRIHYDAVANQIGFMSDNNATVNIPSGWNQGHLTLGNYHLWIDANGSLRIKSSAPTSDADGVTVGSQV